MSAKPDLNQLLDDLGPAPRRSKHARQAMDGNPRGAASMKLIGLRWEQRLIPDDKCEQSTRSWARAPRALLA